MTTPIEALRIARGYIVDDIKRKPSEYDPAGDLKKIDEALASLEGDAVERVALRRTVLDILNSVAPAVENLACNQEQADADGCMVKVSRQAVDEVLAAVNEVAIQAATATGLVADEAAIRADEREKCARIADAKSDAVMAEAEAAHEDKNYNLYGRLECQAGDYADLAAAIRSQEAGR